MRILVTGGAGYIGSRVASHLLEAGMEVIVFDKMIYGGEGLLPLLDRPRFSLVVEDIRNEKVLRDAIQNVEAVVHLAAIVGEPACKVDSQAAFSINYEGSRLFVKLAKEQGVKRFIFISTCSNYGISDSSAYATEDSPLHPLGDYARSKVEAEKVILLEAAGNSFAPCVLRLGTVCGLSPRMRFNLLVNAMARAAALGNKISIFSPNAWRPLLHIHDAARVILHSLTAPLDSISGMVFNVINKNYQKWELVELAKKQFPDLKVEITDATEDPRDYRVTAERITRQLGFNPIHTVEEAFLEVVTAVRCGVFKDACLAIYEALPDQRYLQYP
jgi:nucleoside-diphosphate-sugar epimerase